MKQIMIAGTSMEIAQDKLFKYKYLSEGGNTEAFPTEETEEPEHNCDKEKMTVDILHHHNGHDSVEKMSNDKISNNVEMNGLEKSNHSDALSEDKKEVLSADLESNGTIDPVNEVLDSEDNKEVELPENQKETEGKINDSIEEDIGIKDGESENAGPEKSECNVTNEESGEESENICSKILGDCDAIKETEVNGVQSTPEKSEDRCSKNSGEFDVTNVEKPDFQSSTLEESENRGSTNKGDSELINEESQDMQNAMEVNENSGSTNKEKEEVNVLETPAKEIPDDRDPKEMHNNVISIVPITDDHEDSDDDDEDDDETSPQAEDAGNNMENEYGLKDVPAKGHDIEKAVNNKESRTEDAVLDYDQALNEIKKIDENHQKIMEEKVASSSFNGTNLKRSAEQNFELPVKRKRVEENVETRIKKQLKKMTRKHLENLLAEKLVETCVNKSELGTIRKQCDSYKESTDLWQKRAEALSKQVKDLSTVIKKYILETKTKSTRTKQGPVRITRSVGLQVVQQEKKPGHNRLNPIRGKVKQVNPVRPSAPMSTSPKRPVVNSRPSNPNQRQSIPPIPVQNPRPPLQVIPPVPITKQVGASPEIVEIDLSDDESPTSNSGPKQVPVQVQLNTQPRLNSLVVAKPLSYFRHPAPLPNEKHVINPQLKDVPPKPTLTIKKGKEGVVLSWDMVIDVLKHSTVSSYQLFAYQETHNQRPERSLWKKVGDIKALPLPMACTLKQFSAGNKYHFSVRALDTYKRPGLFSDPASIQI